MKPEVVFCDVSPPVPAVRLSSFHLVELVHEGCCLVAALRGATCVSVDAFYIRGLGRAR